MTHIQDFLIREVLSEDAKAICGIYNPFVTDSTVSFEVEPVTVVEMQKRIADIQMAYPYFVVLVGDQLG